MQLTQLMMRSPLLTESCGKKGQLVCGTWGSRTEVWHGKAWLWNIGLTLHGEHLGTGVLLGTAPVGVLVSHV